MRCGDFKENYIKDEEIFQSRFVKFWLALFFIFLIVFPFIANAHMLYIANTIGFAVIGAIRLNLLTGFTGQISLGHAAFIGVGAYTSAILVTKYGISFWLSIPLAGLLSALAGLVIGIPSLRVKGLYLCIATLAAQFIFGFIFVHWESMTKGITGIHIPPPAIGSFQFVTEKDFYWVTLFFTALAVGYARNLVRSRMGRAFVAIRDRDLAAEIMGINLFRYKLTAFAGHDPPQRARAGHRGGRAAAGAAQRDHGCGRCARGTATVNDGAAINTGVTAVLAHGGNPFRRKVPGAIVVGNGFGKLMGSTQVQELGEIESPILLTCTLCVPRVADAGLTWLLGLPGNEDVRSVNVVVGESNDGVLNDIRRRPVTEAHGLAALAAADTGPAAQGSVGAGRGTGAVGWKGGIGTASRRLPTSLGGWTVGVLVQSNFGGILTVDGAPVGQELGQYYLQREIGTTESSRPPVLPSSRASMADGSIIIVVATDAPVEHRNLERLARRGLAGLARTGSAMTNGSGDYVIAFSTVPVAELAARGPVGN